MEGNNAFVLIRCLSFGECGSEIIIIVIIVFFFSWLGGNQLTGTIPDMGALVNLETLYVLHKPLTFALNICIVRYIVLSLMQLCS